MIEDNMQSETSSIVFLQYLTTVFENIEDVVMLISVEPKNSFKLLLANEAFFKQTGYPRSSIGDNIKDIVGEDSYAHVTKQYRKVITSKQTWDYTYWYNVPIGRQAFDIKLIPILNAVGEVIQLASISRNTTELHKLREKMADATKMLESVSTQLRKPTPTGRV